MKRFVAHAIKAAAAATVLSVSVCSFAETVQLNNAPIRDLVKWYSGYTGRPVLVSRSVSGVVSVFNSDVSPDNVDSVFRAILETNGFEMVSKSGQYIVRPLTHPMDVQDVPADDGQPLASVPVSASRVPSLSSSVDHGGFYETVSLPTPLLETRSYAVNNVRAGDLASVVEVFVKTNSGKVDGSSGSVLSVDGANRLIVSAPKDKLDALSVFLPTVDVPRDQVLMEAVIFETNDGNALEYSFAAGGQTGSPVAGGVNTSSLGSILSSAGGSFGIFNGDVLGLSIKALRTDEHSKVLSVPRILTMSGKVGTLNVGQNVPVVTGSSTSSSSDTGHPFQTITRKDVGISLSVNPTVTPSGRIIMDVSTSADALSSNKGEASDIVTNQRQVVTTVQLMDGQTLLLGGLVSSSDAKSKSSVPVLGDIPFVGRFFTSTSDSHDERVLYILLRARVVRAL